MAGSGDDETTTIRRVARPDASAELCRLLVEAGLVLTFDWSRNVTRCASCGRRAEPGQAFAARMPGTEERECRRLCPTCVGAEHGC